MWLDLSVAGRWASPMLASVSRGAALAVGLAACFGVSGLGLLDHRPGAENGARRYGFQTTPGALAAGQENAETTKPGAEFRECASGCPAMIVIPAGRFSMGSSEGDPDSRPNERPRHEVTIANPIAVSKFEATFNEWDACVAAGACPRVPDRWGRGLMPVINVSWNDAEQYVAWLSRVTGKPYRLLTEAE
jgi:formylglycine-generating enzyme required for sulfatase activity